MRKFKPLEYRNIRGELRIAEESDDRLRKVELWIINERTNLNGWRFENLDKHLADFAGKPILIAYAGGKIGDRHNFILKTDPTTGEKFSSFVGGDAERIIGTISDNESDIKIVEQDGANWVVAQGTLFTWYAKEAVDKIASQGGGMSISIETLVKDGRYEGKNEVYTEYEVLGVTILGDGVAPAVEGAYIKTAAEMEAEFSELKIKAASFTKLPEKGVIKTMSKTAIAEMQTRFPDYAVLGVSEDGNRVCLMSKDGAPFRYIFDGESEIDPAKIERVKALARFEFDDGGIELDMQDATGGLSDELESCRAELAAAKGELESCKAELEAAKTAERDRRVKAVKECVRRELEKINEPRDAKIDENVCEKIDAKADKGEYTECVDESGAWCGESKACSDLKAICMDRVCELDKASFRANSRSFVWGNAKPAKDPTAESGVEGLLARIKK